jgi:SagB-type dehydrogenase family enzyme
LSCPPPEDLPQDTIEEVILRRGSSRRFRRSPISYQQLSIMLDRAARPIPADFIERSDATLNQIYLIANGVDDLPSGSYVYRRDLGALEQVSEGDFREQAGRLDLGQELAADASVNIYFLTDLNAVLQRYGNRGYRMAQMEASITAGRLYLAAYAQKLGATGLTFFDDEVTEFFSPHAEGKSVMFLLAVGRSGRRG